jgi:hypothetical protein
MATVVVRNITKRWRYGVLVIPCQFFLPFDRSGGEKGDQGKRRGRNYPESQMVATLITNPECPYCDYPHPFLRADRTNAQPKICE